MAPQPIYWSSQVYQAVFTTINTGAIDGTKYSDVISIKSFSVWTGKISSDWLDGLNCSCQVVPDINTDVLIGNLPLYNPTISVSTAVRSIRLSPGAHLNISPGVHLTVNK